MSTKDVAKVEPPVEPPAEVSQEPVKFPAFVSKLSPERQQQMYDQRMATRVAGMIAAQNWGKLLDHNTRVAIAEWCRTRDIDPATEVDVLGARPYRNANWWMRKLAEMPDVEWTKMEHIADDPRFAKIVQSKDASEATRIWAITERENRLRRRVTVAAPDWATAVAVFSIKLRTRTEPVVGVNWAGGKGKRPDGKEVDPVGETNPTLTAETRAIRRAARQVVSFLTAEQRQVFDDAEAEEVGLEVRVKGSRAAERASWPVPRPTAIASERPALPGEMSKEDQEKMEADLDRVPWRSMKPPEPVRASAEVADEPEYQDDSDLVETDGEETP
jgi:hypothetical protein